MSDQTKRNCTAINGEDNYADIRQGVRAVCAEFGDPYFRKVTHERRYPEEFVTALTKAGWLSALIPKEYGGLGLGLTEASIIRWRSPQLRPANFQPPLSRELPPITAEEQAYLDKLAAWREAEGAYLAMWSEPSRWTRFSRIFRSTGSATPRLIAAAP